MKNLSLVWFFSFVVNTRLEYTLEISPSKQTQLKNLIKLTAFFQTSKRHNTLNFVSDQTLSYFFLFYFCSHISRHDQSNVKLQSFFKYVAMGPWGEVKSLGLLIEQSSEQHPAYN